MCSIWKNKYQFELSLREIESFFEKSNFFSWIDLTGGEIFLRKDVFDIVRIILSNCKYLKILHFPTNGQFPDLAVSLTKKIAESGNVIPVVTVSIDGDKKISDKIRGIDGAWEKSLETYKRLKELKCGYISLGITLSKYNTKAFNIVQLSKEIKEKCGDFQIDNLHFNLASQSAHYYKNAYSGKVIDMKDIPYVLENLARSLNGKFSAKNFLEKKYLNYAKQYIHKNRIPLDCQALSSNCFLAPNGDLYPCSIYSKKLSNIKDINYSLENYWNSAQLASIYNEIKEGKCPHCWTPCEAYPSIMGSLFHSPKKN